MLCHASPVVLEIDGDPHLPIRPPSFRNAPRRMEQLKGRLRNERQAIDADAQQMRAKMEFQVHRVHASGKSSGVVNHAVCAENDVAPGYALAYRVGTGVVVCGGSIQCCKIRTRPQNRF